MAKKEPKVLDYAAAAALMHKIFEKQTLDVSVFVDGGWGDRPTNISIIADGDGQNPLAYVSKETYERLQASRVIGQNNLRTYKSRFNHPYVGHGLAEKCLPLMDSVARYFPRMSLAEKGAVLRAVSQYMENGRDESWPQDKDGLYKVLLADVGLVLKFGWSPSGRFLSSIRRQPKFVAVAA